ncbi:MAG: hypothetical protein ABEJ82_05830 [Haloplanus sp.]
MRRRILVELVGYDAPVDVETLAATVARSDSPHADAFPVAADAGTVALELEHVHLPKLARSGWVEYDCANGRVSYPDGAEEALAALRTASAELERMRAAVDSQ